MRQRGVDLLSSYNPIGECFLFAGTLSFCSGEKDFCNQRKAADRTNELLLLLYLLLLWYGMALKLRMIFPFLINRSRCLWTEKLEKLVESPSAPSVWIAPPRTHYLLAANVVEGCDPRVYPINLRSEVADVSIYDLSEQRSKKQTGFEGWEKRRRLEDSSSAYNPLWACV